MRAHKKLPLLRPLSEVGNDRFSLAPAPEQKPAPAPELFREGAGQKYDAPH